MGMRLAGFSRFGFPYLVVRRRLLGELRDGRSVRRLGLEVVHERMAPQLLTDGGT